MFLDGDAVHHILDTATWFSVATFFDNHIATYEQYVEEIWLAFIITWYLVYSGNPNRLRTDQGSVITSNRRKQVSYLNVVQLRLPGVEAHSSLSIGKLYHYPLSRIYHKIKNTHTSVPSHYHFKIAINEMKDTMEKRVFFCLASFLALFPDFQ